MLFRSITYLVGNIEEASQDLTDKKRKEIAKIIKENDGDPNTITEKLSTLTGFKIKDS